MTPQASIILPTRNGAQELSRLLPALATQDLPGGFEICAIDTESADDTQRLLEEAGASLEVITKAEFSHGATRNRCAERARGEFLVFLSQDVLPADDGFLRALLEPFGDPRVAGACARVLPHPEDDPLTARAVLDLPEASEEPELRDLDGVAGVWELAPVGRMRLLRFNNVASAIRTSVFREIPFPETSFAEDFAWACRVLTAGWRLAFAPASVAYHAHAYDLRGVFERYRVDAAFHLDFDHHRVRPSVRSALRGFLYEVSRDLRYLQGWSGDGRWRYALRSPGLRGAQVLGQYAGSRGWAHPGPA